MPSTYYDLTNDYNDYGDPIDNAIQTTKKWRKKSCQNDENNNDNSLASDIDPPPNEMIEIEGVYGMDNEAE